LFNEKKLAARVDLEEKAAAPPSEIIDPGLYDYRTEECLGGGAVAFVLLLVK